MRKSIVSTFVSSFETIMKRLFFGLPSYRGGSIPAAGNTTLQPEPLVE
jgi:hypothetical protein